MIANDGTARTASSRFSHPLAEKEEPLQKQRRTAMGVAACSLAAAARTPRSSRRAASGTRQRGAAGRR